VLNGVFAARVINYSPVRLGSDRTFQCSALPTVDCYVILTFLIWRVPLFLMLLRITSLAVYKKSVFLMYTCLVQPCMQF